MTADSGMLEILAQEWDRHELNGYAVRERWGTLRAREAALEAMRRVRAETIETARAALIAALQPNKDGN